MICPDSYIALSVGEPAGIGPDIVIDIAEHDYASRLTVLVDPQLLDQRAHQLGSPLRCRVDEVGEHRFGRMKINAQNRLNVPVCSGQLDKRNAGYVYDSIVAATRGCLSGEYSAMVTAPVHKGIINQAGIHFTGHTELIAGICGIKKPVMMLTNKDLRVALVTTHLPLSEVAAAINCNVIKQVVSIVDSDLRSKFGLASPRILVCGLNPHAGEDGHMGREEIDTIIPCLQELRASGLNLLGPIPADTAFTPRSLSQVDAVIAMYHDQGLPVIKAQGFGGIVNITLGLPIIRTSVDHGTALDLAGTAEATSSSLLAAIEEAIRMSEIQHGT